jgi:hypothetical protein
MTDEAVTLADILAELREIKAELLKLSEEKKVYPQQDHSEALRYRTDAAQIFESIRAEAERRGFRFGAD